MNTREIKKQFLYTKGLFHKTGKKTNAVSLHKGIVKSSFLHKRLSHFFSVKEQFLYTKGLFHHPRSHLYTKVAIALLFVPQAMQSTCGLLVSLICCVLCSWSGRFVDTSLLKLRVSRCTTTDCYNITRIFPFWKKKNFNLDLS
jgi:hypothetical protein